MVNDPVQLKKGYPLIFALAAVILGIAAGIYAGHTPGILEASAILISILVVFAVVLDLDAGVFILVLLNYMRISQLAIENFGAPPIARLFTIMLLLAVGLRWLLTREAPKGWVIPTVFIGVYAISIFTSMFVAEEFAIAIRSFQGFIFDAGVGVTVMLLLQKESSLRVVIWALLIAGLIMCAVNMFQFFTGTFENTYYGLAQAALDMQIVGDTSGARIGGPIGDPNYFAEALVVLVPIALNQFFAEKKLFAKLMAVVVLMLTILTIMLTYSRGGFLALVIVGSISLFYRSPRVTELLLAAAIGIVVLAYLPSNFTARIKTIVDVVTNQMNVLDEGSFAGRTSAMTSAWNMFRDYPFFGVGLDNFTSRYPAYANQLGIVASSTQANSPHNLYLQMASETGIFGLSTFFLLIGYMFNEIRKAAKTFAEMNRPDLKEMAIGIGLGLVGYFISGMFIHDSYPRYLWLMVGVGLSVNIVAKNMEAQIDAEETEEMEMKLLS
jgi:hypothetical protein